MTLRIGICDDTPEDIRILQEHIDHYKIAYDVNFDVDIFLHGQELLMSHSQHPYQIILLDIEIPGQNGMEIARHLRNQGNDDVFIVFITSYPQYMKDSFEVQPFQFLTKPVSCSVIEKLLSDIIHHYQHSHVTKVLIGADGEEHLIHINEIIYIKTMKGKKPVLEYVLQHTTLTAQGTIQKWEESLADYGFISPCRGYLVNVRHIRSFNQTRILLTNNTELPISRRRAKLVQQMYANRIIHIMN